nr:myb/SANT-like domain-containing protein [Tanacetum cinerariifolium]
MDEYGFVIRRDSIALTFGSVRIVLQNKYCTCDQEHMAWQTDYCIMKEGMPILRGWKSIPGMNSSEREMERGYYSALTLKRLHNTLNVMKMTLEKTIEDGHGPCYKKLATLEEVVSKMMRMLMEEKKEDDMGACIEKLDKIGWAAQDPMYDTVLLLFGQGANYRKLWLHLKPESCRNRVKSVGNKYLEGQSMQRSSLFQSDHFIYSKNRFETYVKAKDLDIWHIILNGDFPLVARNKETQVLEMVPFEQQDDDLKYEILHERDDEDTERPDKRQRSGDRHQPTSQQSSHRSHGHNNDRHGSDRRGGNDNHRGGNNNNNYSSSNNRNSGNGRDQRNRGHQSNRSTNTGSQQSRGPSEADKKPGASGRVFAITEDHATNTSESKDLSSLALDELNGNLKVHEEVMKKDSKIYRGKKERVKSIALKAKKESSDDETLKTESDDEEYAMAVRNFKKFFSRKGKFVRQLREEKKSFR